MRHHHKNGLLLLVLVALLLWWVFRKYSETVAATGKAGGTGGGVTGPGSAAGVGGSSGRSSSVVASFGLPAWKQNQSPLKYNEFQPEYQHSLDFYTQMYFPFDVDQSTGVGARGGYLPSNRFWSITDNQQLVRA